MQYASLMVTMGTMKVIMGAPYSAARFPSAALLSWASLSGSELSELLLNFHSEFNRMPREPFNVSEFPTQHMR